MLVEASSTRLLFQTAGPHTHTRTFWYSHAHKVRFVVFACVCGPSDSLNAALCRHQVSLLHTHTCTHGLHLPTTLTHTLTPKRTQNTGHNKVHSIKANTNTLTHTHIHARCVTLARIFSAFSFGLSDIFCRPFDSALHDPHS